eukprot:TRINITY_DN14443_c0_g1_i1.p1 TRINITY_DN14443_c0_g1~~TRINITY_DN14443_c0_g1_i1.p1  ORF type:complete len:193 (-),score=37.23 TRINITY_DN14443_c0_g1_i1:159-737(-)
MQFHTTTGDDYKYITAPFNFVAGDVAVIEVQARNDAHILLSSDAEGAGESYEIVIGGWGNTQSVVRRQKQGHGFATLQREGILSSAEPRIFYITFSTSGEIMVGTGITLGRNILLQYTDPSPYAVRHIAVATGWGSTGVWAVSKLALAPTADEKSLRNNRNQGDQDIQVSSVGQGQVNISAAAGVVINIYSK